MIENLKLITTEDFDDIPCDFYKNINNEYLVTREQIGTALGYSNPRKAIQSIHDKHKDRLDKLSTVLTLGKVEGNRYVERERIFYTRKGVMEICRWSRQPIADQFMDWCWDVVDNLIKEEQQKQICVPDISPQLSLLLNENKYIKNRLSRIEDMVTSLLPPTKHSLWKKKMSDKIKNIAVSLGIDKSGIKGIYGNIYNRMRNDYGMDINNYTADYLLSHKEASNPPAIDVVETYSELKELFEVIVDNYIEVIVTEAKNDNDDVTAQI